MRRQPLTLCETLGAILFWLGVLAAVWWFCVGLPAAIEQGPGTPPQYGEVITE